jgi:RNA polymerase sigma-B factor
MPALAEVPSPDPAAEDEDYGEDQEYGHLAGVLAAYAQAAAGSALRMRLREELVAGYLPVAHHIAQRYANRGEPLEDLKQVACLGLVGAVNRYQPELCRNFLGYAIPTITGEIRRHFRDRTWSMRVPRRLKDLHLDVNKAVSDMTQDLGRAPKPGEIARHLRIPLDDVLEALEAAQAYRAESLDQTVGRGDDATTLGERFGEVDGRYELITNSHSLAPHLDALPEREREILILRFFEDQTQTQIATRFGISQMHVSRLLARTLEQLRTVLTQDTTQDATQPPHTANRSDYTGSAQYKPRYPGPTGVRRSVA